jgi:hypothetical protein
MLNGLETSPSITLFLLRPDVEPNKKILFFLCLDTSILWLLKQSSVGFGKEERPQIHA